jgi:hypothetical protein
MHRYRQFVTHVKVYEDFNEVLTGMSIEYEEGIPCELVQKPGDEVKISLELLERSEFVRYFKPNEYEHMDETELYDNITHVFGSFSTKLEFIGFKCSAGRLYYTGNPNKGHSFLFGMYKGKLHTIKLGINNGITYLKPTFKESKIYNHSLDELASTDDLLEEEAHISNIQDAREKELNILLPYFDDSYIYQNHNEIGQSYFGFFNHISVDNKEHSNYKDFYSFLIHAEQFEDKGCEDSFVIIPQQQKDLEKGKKKYNDFIKKKACLWNKVSVKTLDTKDLLFNEINLNSFINKYIEEIRDQLGKIKFGGKVLQAYGLYDEKEDGVENEKPVDYKILDDRFNKILNNQFRHKTKLLRYKVYNTLVTEKHETLADLSFESGFSDNTFDRIAKTEKMIKNWKKLAMHIQMKVKKVVFLGVFGSLRALQILEQSESGEKEKKLNLDEKLNILEILVKFRNQRKQFVIQIHEFMAKYKDVEEEEDDCEKERTVLKGVNNHRKKLKTVEFTAKKEEKYKKLKEDIESTRLELARKYEIHLDKLKSTHEESLRKNLKLLMVGVATNSKEAYKALFKRKMTFHFDVDTPRHKKTFKDQEIVEDKPFTDELFLPSSNSLCPYNEETKQWIRPRYVSEQDIKDWEVFKWERVERFLDKNYEIFYRGIDVNDIMQGKIGNCYFQSSVAALTHFPQLVIRLFYFKERTNNHIYGVFIRKKGVWELMLIDDYFPVYGKFKPRPAGCIGQDRKELWVMLLEKAWSKLNGSYANAIGGEPYEVFDSLTNATSESIFFVKMNKKKKEKLWESLMNGKRDNFIMTAGTNKMKNIDYNSLGLEAGHAYTLLTVVELENNVRLVKLRNPWANLEWSGPWGDGDKENWTPELCEKLDHTFNSCDGIFFMEFNDFVKYFFNVSICKIYPDFVYECLSYSRNEVRKPNLTIVNIEKPTKIFFQLHQNNPRFSKDFYATVLAFIMLCDKDNKYIASSSSNKSNTSIEADLEPGIYHLYTDINYRFINSDESSYNITTYSKEPVNMAKADDKIEILKVLEMGLIDYSKNRLKPIILDESKFFSEEKCVKLYMKASSKKFPFIFTVVENEFSDINAEVKITLGEQQSYYNEDIEEKEIKKIVNCETIGVFIVVKHYWNTEADIDWGFSCIPKNEKLLQEIVESKGQDNHFDVEGRLVEKTLPYKTGHIVLLMNTSDTAVIVELVMNNLKWDKVNKEDKEIKFELKAMSKMLLHLQKVDPTKEDDYFFKV